MCRFKHPCGYTGTVSKEIGFGIPSNPLRRKPQSPHKVCGFFIFAPSFGGSNGRASALPVSRKCVPGTPTCSSCRPRLESGVAVLANRTDLEATMAHSLNLTAHSSAHVVALPTAALLPIKQSRGPGRRAPNIISLQRFKCSRAAALPAAPAHSVQHALELARNYLRTCERLYQGAREEFMVAQQRAGHTVLSVVP